MFSKLFVPAIALFAASAFAADEPTVAETAQLAATIGAERKAEQAKSAAKVDNGPKALSGMSILGNQEAPKALVIVPWKSSQLGDSLGISQTLDDGRKPIDKDVFMRQLSYYEIRSHSK